jgi:hypothetical protein
MSDVILNINELTVQKFEKHKFLFINHISKAKRVNNFFNALIKV